MSETTKEITKKYAIVDINGTQARLSEGDMVEGKKLAGEKGDKYVSEKVLLIADGENVEIGKPYIDGASVEFVIDSQKKGKKIDIFKYKAKARYRRSYGSRPLVTRLEVKKIKNSKK
ncbi:50S ribosomal protein L21 [Candidatus Dojkabacteria bacterium]|nr:50S ribosomal protein L21 [Candidatus Dojkabacteria bacterium]